MLRDGRLVRLFNVAFACARGCSIAPAVAPKMLLSNASFWVEPSPKNRPA
jgi:hypothetical protein